MAIPKQALFFQTYVLLLAIAGTAYYLARPLNVFWRMFSQKCCFHSRRTRRELDGPFYFTFENAIWPLVVFLFGLVYSIISPIILVSLRFVFFLFFLLFFFPRCSRLRTLRGRM